MFLDVDGNDRKRDSFRTKTLSFLPVGLLHLDQDFSKFKGMFVHRDGGCLWITSLIGCHDGTVHACGMHRMGSGLTIWINVCVSFIEDLTIASKKRLPHISAKM